MDTCPRSRRTAYTLIELLVVIAIIGILAALSFTGLHYAGQSVNRQNAAVDAVKAKVAKSQADSMKVVRPEVKEQAIVAAPKSAYVPIGTTGRFLAEEPSKLPDSDEPARERIVTATESLGAAPEEYIVVFTAGVTDPRAEAQRMAQQYEGRIINVFNRIGKVAVLKIPDRQYERFRQDPKIAQLENNNYARFFQQTIPTAVARTFSYPTTPPHQLILKTPVVIPSTQRNINFGRNPTAGYQMVNIALLDSGVDLTHPDLNVVMALACSNAPGNQDSIGHGTHGAGTIGAKNNSFGVLGVYPGAPIWSMRIDNVDGSIPASNILQALSLVYDNSASIHIANMGFGLLKSATVDNFANACAQKGVVMVAAAGNFGVPAANYSPASAGSVVCVASMVDTDGKPGKLGPVSGLGADDTMDISSNFGSAVHVIAPGVNVNSTFLVSKGSYTTASGTSVSCAIVSGYLAMLMDSKSIFGRPSRNVFYTYRPGVAIGIPGYVRVIATESIPGIFADPLSYPMVNFRILYQ